MRRLIIAFAMLMTISSVSELAAAGKDTLLPYEASAWSTPETSIDRIVAAELKTKGLSLWAPASDSVFLRRVYLDLIGAMPTRQEAESFLADTDPDKRPRLIARLFDREEYADYLSLRLGDILRIKSEFPSNLWPNAVQAYHRWIREAVRGNMPYDSFARELLTSSGSNFRVPQGNFYRAVQARDPASLAATVSLTFLGTRFQTLSEPARADMAVLFSRIGYKKTLEWKEEIVFSDSRALDRREFVMPDGGRIKLGLDTDPRVAFADWLGGSGRMWFASAFANRAWQWLMGTGIAEPADDMGPGKPVASQALLTALAADFIASGYDIRALFSAILNSRIYQQSSVSSPTNVKEPESVQFARYKVRRLDAEVLIDGLCRIGGTGESYSSPIPEPFTFIPKTQRTIALADGSITSPFLVKFGRPSRDSGLIQERNNGSSLDQALYLLNSTDVRKRIENSPVLAPVYGMPSTRKEEQVRLVYLELLSRPPTPKELSKVLEYFKSLGLSGRQAVMDLAWALVNGKEFLYRH
jgi:hypothetical protein